MASLYTGLHTARTISACGIGLCGPCPSMTSGQYAFRLVVVVLGGAIILYGRCVSSRHLWRQTSIALELMICGCYRCLGVIRRHWPAYRIEVAPASWMSSSGLTLLMLIAFCIRLHMHDSVALSLPSFLTHLGEPFHLCQINASARRKRDAT